MSEYRDVLERTRSRFQVPTLPLEEVLRRRDVRRRRQRVVAGAVAVAIAAAIAWAGTTAIRGEQQVPIRPGPSLLRTYRLLNVSDGSEAPFPAPEGGSWFRFSPGGSDVIFVKDDADGRPQLFRMRADGSDVGQITPDPEWALEAAEPAWSADGRWIAYSGVTRSGQREIIATRPSGYHPPRAGLSWGVGDARAPSWSPDGSKMAFVSQGIRILHMQYYNGNESITSGPPRLIVSAGTSPAWSPTGDQIAFISGQGTGRRLAIANADGTRVREITDTTSDHPTWSPDGGTIAYDVWSSDGHVAVWLRDLRTGQTRQLLNDASVESWKDDGTLLVATYLDTTTTVTEAPATTGSSSTEFCSSLEQLDAELFSDIAKAGPRTPNDFLEHKVPPQFFGAPGQLQSQEASMNDLAARTAAGSVISDAQAIATWTPSSTHSFAHAVQQFERDGAQFRRTYCSGT